MSAELAQERGQNMACAITIYPVLLLGPNLPHPRPSTTRKWGVIAYLLWCALGPTLVSEGWRKPSHRCY